MIRVIVAAADQALAQQIQGSLVELDDAEVAFVAATSAELTEAVLREQADVALVHEDLGPEPVLSQLRDLSVRRPATAMLLVATDPGAEMVTQAMEAGARGLVSLPLSLGQLEGRLAAAAAWSSQMRRILGASRGGSGEEDPGRGRVVGFAGAKGGVGVTTIVSHLALDVARTVPSLEVCLVDLDLEAGDVPSLVEVRQRVSIADLAKVADDLSPGTLADAVTHHASGVDMLLAPLDVREVEAVTPRALRLVVAALRREYDLVLVDLGAHVTPAQATVLELADEVVLVVNPDVASLRGMRRTVNAWESLGVAKESDLRVLVNRSSKQVTVSRETVRQLTRAAVLPVALQAAFRKLEPPLNARDPLELRHPQWWRDLRHIGREIGLVPQSWDRRRRSLARASAAAARSAEPGPRTDPSPEPATGQPSEPAAGAPPAPSPASPIELVAGPSVVVPPGTNGSSDIDSTFGPPPNPPPVPVPDTVTVRGDDRTDLPRGSSGASGRRRRDRGALTLESVALIPLFFVIAGLVWHVALYGAGAVLQANAAAAAARAAGMGYDSAEVQHAAEEAVPDYLADRVETRTDGLRVTVTMTTPGIVEGFPGLPTSYTSTREVVAEP